LERKNIVLISVNLEIKQGKDWIKKTILDVISKGNDTQEIIKNIKADRLFKKGKLKEYRIKGIEVIKEMGITNYKE
jgi:hypothetical protein